MSIRLMDSLLSKFRNTFLVDFGELSGTVILAGTGRSGTTWVENIINANNDYRVMFEPFYSGKIDLLSGWKYRQYLRVDDRRDIYLDSARTILSGNIRDNWVDRYNTRWVAKKRLVKDIRIMLFLGWIKSNFPEIPIVFLMRHPCAVALSKVKLGWDTHLDEFVSQPELLEDYLAPYEDLLGQSLSVFEKHIVLWCVESYVPLCQFSSNEILVVFYEELCANPDVEVKRIYSHINSNVTDGYEAAFSTPSALSRKESAINTGSDLVDAWRNALSDAEVSRAIELCGLFGLDRVYGAQSMPLVSGAEVLNMFDDQHGACGASAENKQA